MIDGLFLDPRIWEIDYKTHPNWNPEKFGVHIDLHPDPTNIPKLKIDEKYKFVIATEVWEIPIRKSLEYLKSNGIVVFFAPREMLPADVSSHIMFRSDHFLYNNTYYYRPDVLLSPSKFYSRLWDKSKVDHAEIIGSARYDSYAVKKFDSKIIKQKYGIENNKRIVFFPSYPPSHYQIGNDGKEFYVDLYNDLNATMETLEEYAKTNKDSAQIIVKIHPMAQKLYNKKYGNGKDVKGIMEKYYKNPTNYFKVIGDVRRNGNIAKELVSVADLVVGFRSTMLLEACFLKKPNVHVVFDECSKLKGLPEYIKDFFEVKNKEELLMSLNEADISKFFIKNADALLEYCFSKIDGNFCSRFCTEIKKYCVK